MSGNPRWIVTVAKVPEHEPFPGSVVRWCGLCGCDVWLSQEAARTMDESPTKLEPLCLDCAVPMMADAESVNVSPVDPTATTVGPANRLIRRLVKEKREEKGRS